MPTRIEIFELKEKLTFLQTNRVSRCIGGYGPTQGEFYKKVGVIARSMRDCLDPTNGRVGLSEEDQNKFAECCKFLVVWDEWIDPKAGVAGHVRQDTADAFATTYLREHKKKDIDSAKKTEKTEDIPIPGAQPPRLAEDLKTIIRKAPGVLRYLQQQRGMEALPLLKSPAEEKALDQAAKHLLSTARDVSINAHYEAYRTLCKDRPAQNAGPIEDALIKLALRVVPALHSSDDAAKIKAALGQDTTGLVVLEVYQPTVAEIHVAAAEGRGASYLNRVDRDDWPSGERNFPEQAPDSGFDSPDERLNDLKRQLSDPFSTSGAGNLYETFRSFLAGSSYFKRAKATDFSPEFKCKMACKELKFLMKRDGQRFYMTFPLPKNEHDRAALRDLVAKLEEDIRGMLFLGLDATEETVEAEYEHFRPLIEMLPVQPKGKSA